MSEVLDRLVVIARQGWDGIDEVSIILVGPERPYTAAYSWQLVSTPTKYSANDATGLPSGAVCPTALIILSQEHHPQVGEHRIPFIR